MEQFIGKFISLSCDDPLGVFQGQIVHVDPCSQKITLEKAFQNGYPYHSRQVTISAKDIKNLEMIEAYSDPPQAAQAAAAAAAAASANIKRPVAKKAAHLSSDKQFSGKESAVKESPRKNTEDNNNKSNNCNETVRAQNRRDKQRQRWMMRDEEAFGSPVDHHMPADFDFEKNLALFNKKAFYEEINASKPDVVRNTDKKGARYRCEENILNSKPPVYRQLLVPQGDSVEYVTDSGLVVPSLTPDLRKKIMAVAERFGLSFERQSEIIGRACTEMAMLLLGGARRLNPQNQHQVPNVAVLCGSHRTGSQGVNCARQLASQGVKTIVYIQDPVDLTTEMTHELALYRMTSNKVTTNLQDLCSASVDLIILALLDSKSTAKDVVTPAARWANENRAQVLAIDPPQNGTPGVTAKFSLVPALPLAYNACNGRIYLCNINIPLQVFQEVGIVEYVSPFGPKFFMALYPNDTIIR